MSGWVVRRTKTSTGEVEYLGLGQNWTKDFARMIVLSHAKVPGHTAIGEMESAVCLKAKINRYYELMLREPNYNIGNAAEYFREMLAKK